VTEKEQNQSGI